jgi:hypothetical protein
MPRLSVQGKRNDGCKKAPRKNNATTEILRGLGKDVHMTKLDKARQEYLRDYNYAVGSADGLDPARRQAFGVSVPDFSRYVPFSELTGFGGAEYEPTLIGGFCGKRNQFLDWR